MADVKKEVRAKVKKMRVVNGVRKMATGLDGTTLFVEVKGKKVVGVFLKSKKGIRLATVLGGSEESKKRCYNVTFDADHNASYQPVSCSQPHNLAIYDD